jgi:hypothetical protein
MKAVGRRRSFWKEQTLRRIESNGAYQDTQSVAGQRCQ